MADTARKKTKAAESGFTLIELMTVITIIGVLVAIALPNYKAAIIQAKEAVLKEDLFQFENTLSQYAADKGKYPASLEDLVREGYLREIPVDPMTGGTEWEVVYEPADSQNPGAPLGIWDVKSTSTLISLSGKAYNEW